jgi:hypothetical protein
MSLARESEHGGATSTGLSGRAPHEAQPATQVNGKAPPAEDLDPGSHGGASGK